MTAIRRNDEERAEQALVAAAGRVLHGEQSAVPGISPPPCSTRGSGGPHAL